MKKLILLLTMAFTLCVGPAYANPSGNQMIEPNDLLENVIDPVLVDMDKLWRGANHPAARYLLLGTLFQESTIGSMTYLEQKGGGPGNGPYQIEPDTHLDNYANYLIRREAKMRFTMDYLSRVELPRESESMLLALHERANPSLDANDSDIVATIVRSQGMDSAITSNLKYATVQARLKYWRSSFVWPADPLDIDELGSIWDVHYNANDKHGFPADFVAKFPVVTF